MADTGQTRFRILLVMAVLAAAMLGVAAQFFRLQVIQRQGLAERGYAQHRGYQKETLPARRGAIYDRRGFLLAASDLCFDVYATPKDIPDVQKAAARLFPYLKMTQQQIVDLLTENKDARAIRLAHEVPREDGEALLAMRQAGTLPGIRVDPLPVRVYPVETLAAHVLGFVNRAGETYYGLERWYDQLLRGKDGWQRAERDPFEDAVPISMAEYEAPQDGATLYLTIDRTAQFMVERELTRAITLSLAIGGSALVLDVRTGAVIAMASWPTYDPNRYAEVAALDDDLFVNPVISNWYEPGSVFKIVTVAAGIDSGVITPDTLINDPGAIEVGGAVITNWDYKSHGIVDVTTVLAKSLNVGVAQVAAMLGPERFYTYVKRFGFGQRTGIDLAGEAAGLVRTPEDAKWTDSDLGTHSFGQGIAATPLQMAAAVAAIANDGWLMKPYVVQRIVKADQTEVVISPQRVRQVVRPETARQMTAMLVNVVEREVTAAQVAGYQVAGKSGTAQIPVTGGYDPEGTIASFCGFFPADDPRFVVLIVLNRPKASEGWGSLVAAPAFARIVKQLAVLFEVPPDDVRHQLAQRANLGG